jgi:hypothetical protein
MDSLPIYSAWIGIPIFLFVIRECQVPIPCNIIAESVFDIRIQLDSGWEIDVPKELILAIEEATRSQEIYLN